jgi:hypothetical protein
LGKRYSVVLGIQAAMLTVAPKARSKAGWVIFFMWLRFKQVIYGEDLIFGKNTGFASDI